MNRIQYSPLKYYNSPISEECLYVGILFNDLTTGIRTFKSIKNFKRLESFDDEVDTNFFKFYLGSIREEVESSILNYGSCFDFEEYTKTYVNEFRFSKIITIDTSEHNFIEDITRLYLKYDFDKKQRLNKNLETKYIRDIFKSNQIAFSSRPVIGIRNEPISYDFQTDQYAIKIFSFKDKDLNRLISSAKLWAYNALEMKAHKKTIFLYDLDIVECASFEIIMEILKEHAYKVMSMEDGIGFVSNIA